VGDNLDEEFAAGMTKQFIIDVARVRRCPLEAGFNLKEKK
jgi:hypothetical protein